LANWGTARAFRNPAVFSSFAQRATGIHLSWNQLGLRDVSSILLLRESEHPEYSDSRPMLTMFTPPPGRITTLSSAYSRNRRQRLFLRAAHGYVRYAQCNVQACVVQRLRPTEGHTHAASDQLHRGLLWQRLTCRPGMLGGSWKLGRRGTEFLFHVRAWLAKNVDVIDREDHGTCSYMYLSFWKCRPAFTC
jgi:hypothetical protein